MEHFLVIGSIKKECSVITALLEELYPGCKTRILYSVAGGSTAHADNLSLLILCGSAALENGSVTLHSLHQKSPVLFIADSDEDGLKMITAGAGDYVLAAEITSRFPTAVRKAIARKDTAAMQALTSKAADNKDAYELMLISLNEVVWSKNPGDLKLEFINNACESLFGYTREELINDHDLFVARIHPDDREQYENAFRRMQRSGNLEEYEFRFQTKNGTWKNLKGKGTMVKGDAGGKNMLTGITIDITRQVTSENIVKEKTREFEEILESISECFYSVDKDWRFTYLNKAIEDLFQVKREDLLGKALWEAFPLGRDTEMYTNYHLAVQKKRGISFEAYSPNIKKWIFTSAYPRNGGLIIFLKDMSVRKELEQRIITEQQNLLSIINATSDVIWSVDKDLNILIANQAFWDNVTRTHGRTKEEIGARITEEIYGKEIVQHWKEIYNQIYEGLAFKIVETNNSILGITYSEISLNPIRDLDNNIVGMSCFSRDITKTTEHLLKIEEQNQKMREIAWIQSHKVRGPVSTILGLAELFNMADPDNSVNQRVLEGIKETTLYLDDVIREIVNKAKAIE